jgi:hypothetical protein
MLPIRPGAVVAERIVLLLVGSGTTSTSEARLAVETAEVVAVSPARARIEGTDREMSNELSYYAILTINSFDISSIGCCDQERNLKSSIDNLTISKAQFRSVRLAVTELNRKLTDGLS